MPVKTRTETKTIDHDLVFDPDDNPEREESLARAFVEHDSLTFDGLPLRPVTAGTIMLMQRANNRLLLGDTSNVMADAAGFILIHTEDNKPARRAIFGGSFDDYLFEFLDSLEHAQSKLMGFAPTIARMMEDYANSQTQSLSTESNAFKKKSGRRIG
jgi:hypothetical protein